MPEEISDEELKLNQVTRGQYNMAVGLLEYFESRYNKDTDGDYNEWLRNQIHEFIDEQEKLVWKEKDRQREEKENE